MALVRTSTVVYCTTSFVAFHSWENAPADVGWLKNPHRHVFHVKVSVAVGHDDRAVEFQTLRQDVDRILWANFQDDQCRTVLHQSCEMIADQIAGEVTVRGYKVTSVEVSEDGENGAILFYA